MRPSDPLAFALGILHPGAHTRPDDGQFQLREHSRHLDEGLRHRINLAAAAIHRDAAHNNQAQLLALDYIYDFAKLLCAAAQAADFQCDDGIAFLSLIHI